MTFAGVLRWLEGRRTFSTFFAVFYAAAIFYFSGLPSPPSPGWPLQDVLFHFFEYLGFGVVVCAAAGSWGRGETWFVFVVCAIYAVGDEAHQIFVPNRSFSTLDIVLDALGSAVGILAYGRMRERGG